MNNSQRTIQGIVAPLQGATSTVAGTSGSAPAPSAGSQTKFLSGSGTYLSASQSGAGTPEAVVTGSVGDIYWDTTANLLYVKDTGNNTATGWVATTNAAGTWTSYTPTITGGVTNPTLPASAVTNASYMVIGKTMYINYSMSYSAQTGGANGSGSYRWSIPVGYTIDLTKAVPPTLTGTAADSGYDGVAIGTNTQMNSGANYIGKVVAIDSTTVGLFGSTLSGTNRGLRGSTFGTILENAAPTHFSFNAVIPLV